MLVAAKVAGTISKVRFRNDGTITKLTDPRAMLKKITTNPKTRGEFVSSTYAEISRRE